MAYLPLRGAIQRTQMRFGSLFLRTLHEQWTSLIERDPQVRTNSFALVGVCAGFNNDGVVPHASAAMNNGLVGTIKYIPAKHFDHFEEVNSLCSEEPIIEAYSKEHRGYQFIRDFLLGNPLGEDDKTNLGVTSGMLITQLYDRKTGDGVPTTKIRIDNKRPRDRFTSDNSSTKVKTLLNLKAGKRSLLLVPPVAYQPPARIDVRIKAGQATVILVPVQKR